MKIKILSVMVAVAAMEFFMVNDLKACVTIAPQVMTEGVKYVLSGKPNEAIIDFNMGLADGYNNRGEAFAQLGRWKEALSDFHMAITINPKDSRPYTGIGQYFLMKGKYNEAIVEFKKAVQVHDRFSLSIVPQLAWIHFMKGDSDLAFKDYNFLVKVYPQNTYYRTMRGMVSYERKDLDHALTDFNDILTQNPKEPSAYFGRSLVYAAKGEMDLARQDLAIVRNNYKGLGEICMSWAQAFEISGFHDKAREYLHYGSLINPELKKKYADLIKKVN